LSAFLTILARAVPAVSDQKLKPFLDLKDQKDSDADPEHLSALHKVQGPGVKECFHEGCIRE
jgi:hypothetical protein